MPASSGKIALTMGDAAATGTYRLDAVIDRCPVSRLQKLVIAFCALVTAIDGFDAQMIGFLAGPIADSFHRDVRSFGPLFSLGLMGLMAGTLTMGAIGDRWGRRRALIASVLTVGVFTGLSAFAQSLAPLLALRFVTGFGIGGAMPNTIALVAEYTPKRWRALAICFSAACISIGSMSSGLCASVVMPIWGWRAMFAIGGVVPLLIGAAVALAIPESVRFLNLDPRNRDRVRRIMARIWPEGVTSGTEFETDAVAVRRSVRVQISELFRDGRAPVTLLLWLTYFMNLLILYVVVSWMPALLKAANLPSRTGVFAVSAFGLGGIIGSLGQAPLMQRFTAPAVLIAEFALFIVTISTLSVVTLTTEVALTAVLIIGTVIQGAQAGLNVFTAAFYPTSARSTGIGWGLGIGRLGSIIGPLLAGAALMAGWNSRQIFAAAALPGVCAALAVAISASILSRRAAAQNSAASAPHPIIDNREPS